MNSVHRTALCICFSLAAQGCGSSSHVAGGPGSSGGQIGPPPPVTCAEPTLKSTEPGDAQDDAAGRGQMFEQIELPGMTDVAVDNGTGGVALVDLNNDGLPDVFAVSQSGTLPGAFRFYLNQGCWKFQRQDIVITNPDGLPTGTHAIPVFADFNDDGFLDFYLTGDPQMNGNLHPSLLFMARGDYKTFEEVGKKLGVDGGGVAYGRQSQIADLDGDGHLDIAVAADQIGDRTERPGRPWQHLYIYRPKAGSSAFEDGHYEDIGGTDVIPGFGGEPNDDPQHDRDSPGILVRDIDDDGDLDVVQSYHDDMLLGLWFSPSATGERHHGVWVWKNQLSDTGQFKFLQDLPGTDGLVEEGWSKYDVLRQEYVAQQHAVGLPYITAADVDNDGDLDILVVGPTDTEWHVHTDQIAAKFWRNDGLAGFHAATDEAGLGPLNWGYGQWFDFLQAPPAPAVDTADAFTCALSNQKPKCLVITPAEHQMYLDDIVWGDFNNDGWIDFVAVDRRENETGYGKLRNILFLNQGDGTFKPIPTTVSGIDENSIAAEAADLNGDGLLDLYFVKNITNSQPFAKDNGTTPHDEFTDSVFWNTGEHGGRANHWLEVRLTGAPQARLIGTKLLLHADDGHLMGRRDLFPVTSYKSSVHQEVHFGLGQNQKPSLHLVLPGGRVLDVPQVPIDDLVQIDVRDGSVHVVRQGIRQIDTAAGGP